MKRHIGLSLACFAVIASLSAGLTGCGKGSEGVSSYMVELQGNITTGYEWICTFSQPGIVKQVISDYKSDGGTDTVGAGGVFIFEFEGVQPGEVELLFSYIRPWEEGGTPAETASCKLVVDKKLLIHAEDMQGQLSEANE